MPQAAAFAAGRVAERLPVEAHADVLTALVSLAVEVSQALQLLVEPTHAAACAATPSGTPGQPLATLAAKCTQQLLEASHAALGRLQQHPVLACKWMVVLCDLAACTVGNASSSSKWACQLKPKLASELRHALGLVANALSSPPKEVFADIGGAPTVPEEAQQPAARKWHADALAYSGLLPRLLELLASLGALEPLGGRQSRNGDSRGGDDEASAEEGRNASNIWDELRVASCKAASGREPNGHSNGFANAGLESLGIGAPLARDVGEAAPKQQRVLIEELASAEEPEQAAKRRAEARTISAGGVIIEEIEGDSDDEEEPDQALGVLELVRKDELAAVLIACAAQSRDAELDAPWATEASHAAAGRVLDALGAHIGAAQDSTQGVSRGFHV